MVASWVSSGLNSASLRGLDFLRGGPPASSDQAGQNFLASPDYYTMVEQYYWGAAYALDNPTWDAIRQRNALPRSIRPVLPLIKPAIDWWPGHVYPAIRTNDGDVNRIPFRQGTPPEITLAVRQAFTWGNWSSDILTYVHQAALLRETFAEVQVDYVRRKVYPKLWHPRFVTDIEWDDSGNLVMYRLDIPRYDDDGNRYLWGKIVTKKTITTLKDDRPFDYDGQGANIVNPWGFVPGVWVMFRNVGAQHGAGVADGLFAIIDELNGLQASVDDYIHQFINQIHMVASKYPDKLTTVLMSLSVAMGQLSPAESTQERDSQRILPAPEEARAFPLISNIGLGESAVHFDRLMKALERNLPELVLSEKLQAMDYVSRPGSDPLVMDVQHKLDEVCGNLDPGITKLGQMCLSIMGELVNTGEFGLRSQLTEQQQLFLPFSLKSWDKGELKFSLAPRELLPTSPTERASEAAAIEDLQSVWALKHVGLSDGELFGLKPDGTPNDPPPDVGLWGHKEAASAAVAEF